MKTRSMYLLAAVAISTSVFAQGVRWESTTTREAGETRVADKFSYMPKKMKMVDGSEGRFVIIRLDREVMVMGDPEKKQYFEMTFDEMEQMMEGANAAMDAQMEAMRQQLAALPKEQREMAEKMMGGRMKPTEPVVEVTKTGETKTVSGYTCTKYVVKEDGETVSTVWATSAIPGFEVMKEDMEAFAKRMKAMMKRSGSEKGSLTEGVEGFPMMTEMANGMKSEVTKIEFTAVPASEFEVPAGFEKEEMPGMPEGY